MVIWLLSAHLIAKFRVSLPDRHGTTIKPFSSVDWSHAKKTDTQKFIHSSFYGKKKNTISKLQIFTFEFVDFILVISRGVATTWQTIELSRYSTLRLKSLLADFAFTRKSNRMKYRMQGIKNILHGTKRKKFYCTVFRQKEELKNKIYIRK